MSCSGGSRAASSCSFGTRTSTSSRSSASSRPAGAGLSTVDRAVPASGSERGDDGVAGDLELGEHDTRAGERGPRDVGVGARHDDDRVLAALVDGDDGATGRVGDSSDERRIGAGLDHGSEQPATGIVVADGGDERRAGAGAGGGDGLVQALAAGVLGVGGAEHRLAGPGEPRGRGDEVEVGAADDADVERLGGGAHWCTLTSCDEPLGERAPVQPKTVVADARVTSQPPARRARRQTARARTPMGAIRR